MKVILWKTLALILLTTLTAVGLWLIIENSIQGDVIGNKLALLGFVGPFATHFLLIRIMGSPGSARWAAPLFAFFAGCFLGLVCGVLGTSRSLDGVAANALVATMITSISIVVFLLRFRKLDVTQFLDRTAQMGKLLLRLALMDCLLAVAITRYQSRFFSNTPESYLAMGAIIVIGIGLFVFSFRQVQEALENKSEHESDWFYAFNLLFSTLWIYVAIYFLMARSKSSSSSSANAD